MPAALVVLTTVPSAAIAQRITTVLLRKRLAACVSRVGGLRSTYRWKGRMETTSEILLVIKTSAASYAALETALRANHPYDVPEILALPVRRGAKSYLDWIIRETRQSR